MSKLRYRDSRKRTRDYGDLVDLPIHTCEHCDGEHSPLVREDPLRGHVCPSCDSSLDEMLEEGAFTPKKGALTADTITDDQIRELRARLGSETYAGASTDATDCDVAHAAPIGSLRRVQARARCAEILNARAKEAK